MKWGFDRKTSQSCITKPKLGWFSDRSAYICIFNTWNRKKKERRHCINIGVLWWQIYCSWIQCTMFWWHGALFCGFNFDAAGQWGQKGQKQPVKFIPVSLLFSPVPEFPEGFWHLFCVVLFFTAAAFQDPLNGLCRIQGQTSSKSLPQLNYSIPDEQVAWLLFAN